MNRNIEILDHWKLAGFIATLVIALSFPLYLLRHSLKTGNPGGTASSAYYTGGESCRECHIREYDDWLGSDHARAMEVASPESVKGDFNNVVFVAADGTETRFMKRDSGYYVYTPGPGGKPAEYKIAYTFGTRPLQQYLIAFENGRYQCLPIAWDTERNNWYSLPDSIYREEHLTPDNWLYWTNNGQNWNGMCADCHSTNLRKGYDPETHQFKTVWSDIDVHCEACHGPGSEHLKWANLPDMARDPEKDGLLVNTRNLSAKETVTLCARCHTRRSVLGDFNPDAYQKDPLNYMTPQLPVPPAYYGDGQILDEDYVFGSFTQSYMYHQEVSCKDCHNVHSGKLILPTEDNQLCLQCHRAAEYDTYEHHFHKKPGEGGKPLHLSRPWMGKKTISPGEGSLCINCHMPGRFYMGVDFRRDHSFRVPRPDLSQEFGVPNACNDCHTDKTYAWATSRINEWYGPKRKLHFGEIFLKAGRNDTSAFSALRQLATDELYPVMIRATAVYYLQFDTSAKSMATIRQALEDPESLIRLTALETLPPADPQSIVSSLTPLLQDPVKAIRARAAFRLSAFTHLISGTGSRQNYEQALAEYRQSMEYMGDFASARHNLGVLYGNMGNPASAARQYSEALRIDSLFYPSMTNLAMVYNQLGQNNNAVRLLRRLVELRPDMGEAYYYLGLLMAEMNDPEQSLKYLLQAREKLPDNARITYNLALLYQQMDLPDEAESCFGACLEREPDNYDYLYAAGVFYLNQRNKPKAAEISRKLNRLFPGTQGAEALARGLENQKEQIPR